MKFKITREMVSPTESTIEEQEYKIQRLMFEQKYGRAPSLMEYMGLGHDEPDIAAAARRVIETEFFQKYGWEAAV